MGVGCGSYLFAGCPEFLLKEVQFHLDAHSWRRGNAVRHSDKMGLCFSLWSVLQETRTHTHTHWLEEGDCHTGFVRVHLLVNGLGVLLSRSDSWNSSSMRSFMIFFSFFYIFFYCFIRCVWLFHFIHWDVNINCIFSWPAFGPRLPVHGNKQQTNNLCSLSPTTQVAHGC